jgi:putative endonuclease
MFQNQNKSTKDKGKEAEELATKFLKEKNYTILKRNFHFGNIGEIDIIAKDKDTVVFVEVKARSNPKFYDPLEAITKSKQKNLIAVAKGYIMINDLINTDFRFDIISIDYSVSPEIIEHLENAIVMM